MSDRAEAPDASPSDKRKIELLAKIDDVLVRIEQLKEAKTSARGGGAPDG